MVEFSANPTDPPDIDSDDAGGTVMNWLGYIVVIGTALGALGVAQSTVKPVVEGVLEMVPGLESGDNGGGLEL